LDIFWLFGRFAGGASTFLLGIALLGLGPGAWQDWRERLSVADLRILLDIESDRAPTPQMRWPVARG